MCGIIGIILSNPDAMASPELLDSTYYLQHRGQDAAGIVTCGSHGRFYQCKGNGMARDVFTPNKMSGLVGSMGIAHLRYPTAGSSSSSEAQPFYVNSPYGISMAHNGNLVNGTNLKKYLDEDVHRHINTDSDSELLLNIFAAELEQRGKIRVNTDDIFKALLGVFNRCVGGYACVGMLAGYGIFGFRDPHGVRPLVFGERVDPVSGKKDYMFASESVALQSSGFTQWRDILPGEAVIVPKDTMQPVFKQVIARKSYSPDIFEYVYFARPDSVLDGISVYRSRLAMGDMLAENIRQRFAQRQKSVKDMIDVVIPVPDTSRDAALKCAVNLGLPYREGFVKNRYIGRTFIMPNQKERKSSVRRKLNAMSTEFRDKNVLLIDDSIVRGTTSKEIVQMAQEAGAKAVYFASCAPAIRYNHIYGIDLADPKALVAFNRSDEEVAGLIGADEVIYQNLDDLIDCVKNCGENKVVEKFEVGVFTGDYITGVEEAYFAELEHLRAQEEFLNSDEDTACFNANGCC
ncbi:Amidophosphoribosyltransferase [Nadsonia fulvescens var. elongata DSM 6958]|uniref:Amidophosphoribosyltransferase n=1 Tax=Nadsonia fulvescens var. elongata DSM 6958 TaxID=857566 RepID=A0A1E3PP73_9ASCO|nr:Amidophosphoribosyltransferase [Nadsonia fulvescens var. elongata DSM 6958]